MKLTATLTEEEVEYITELLPEELYFEDNKIKLKDVVGYGGIDFSLVISMMCIHGITFQKFCHELAKAHPLARSIKQPEIPTVEQSVRPGFGM